MAYLQQLIGYPIHPGILDVVGTAHLGLVRLIESVGVEHDD
jgi:hypothetical protein